MHARTKLDTTRRRDALLTSDVKLNDRNWGLDVVMIRKTDLRDKLQTDFKPFNMRKPTSDDERAPVCDFEAAGSGGQSEACGNELQMYGWVWKAGR